VAEDPTAIAIRNLVTLRRLSNGLAKEMRSEVRGLIDEYVSLIAKLDPTAVVRDSYRRARVEKVLKEINSLNAERYPQIRRVLETTTAQIGAQQAEWATNSLQRTIGSVRVSTKGGLGVPYFRSIMKTDPFDGDTLKMWVKRHEVATVNAVRQQIQLGMAQSETLGDIVRRIRGRSAGGGRFTGGVLATSTKQAEGIARTAITHIANRGHLAAYEQNADVLKGVEFTATLDSRTTEICARWDGTVFSLDDPKKQTPPLHFNCRSVLVPAVDWEGLGIEPPPEGKRASAGGPVPSSTTYEQWFGNQPAQTQNSIIGVARAGLFRAGQITFRDMIGKDNRVLTLAELPALRAPVQSLATTPVFETRKEAEAWAVENLVKAPERYGKAAISYRGLSIASANEINARVAKMLAATPTSPRLNAIRARSMPKKQWAARYETNGQVLEINTAWAKTPDAVTDFVKADQVVNERAREAVKALKGKTLTARQERLLAKAEEALKYKRSWVGNDLDGLITHEMGHHIHNNGATILGIERKEFRELWTEATKQAAQEKYRYNISSYAFRNPMVVREEVFAESVALFVQGNTADIPPKMLSLLNRIFET
tara:strand:- start:1738 stop:3531 length:1794 start_codon:yes stop_codon:yes gene_type:complete